MTNGDRRSVRRRHRLGARAALKFTVLALLVVSAVLLVACTPPGLPDPIAPVAGSVVAGPPAPLPQVTIGVDGTVRGFNPHAIADYSPAAAAVAALVLPGVSAVAADGSVQLNTDVVQQAAVTSTDPFTVTYTLDRNAAWSDGTPITAEDFSYLREQMLVQPGTVDPAGYRLISAIDSKNAGKTVEVTFTRAPADWKTLFSPLLPAHLLKDSPGGWAESLTAGLPVSGNRYKMQSYDTVTGEITLVRNDKYWGTQPGTSIAVLRIGTSSALIQALGRGDVDAVLLQPDGADQRTLEAGTPAAQRAAVQLPGTVQLVFDNLVGPSTDPAVRRAIALALDLNSIRTVLDGGNAAGGTAAPSLVTLPGPPTGQATPTAVPGEAGDSSAAVAELGRAGYTRQALYQRKGGKVLRLRLAYGTGDSRMAAAAKLIQTQLATIGVEVDLVRDDLRAVVGSRLALGTVDLGLLMVPRGSSDALAAGSAFGCPRPAPATQAIQSTQAVQSTQAIQATRTGQTPLTVQSQAIPPGAAGTQPAPRAGNLSGFCSPGIQPLLEAATSGPIPPGLESALAAAVPTIQIERPSAVFATSPRFAAVIAGSGPGWTFSTPLMGLASWPSK